MALVIGGLSLTPGAGASSTAGSARIGYDNVLERGTVTASSEAAGFSRHNAYDWLTYDFWRPTAGGDQWLAVKTAAGQAVNYVAIAAHDLHKHGATIKMQASSDGGTTWTDICEPFGPADSGPIMLIFSEVSQKDFRLHVNASAAFSVGVVCFGKATVLERGLRAGFAPPNLSPESTILNSESEGGQFLGRSLIRKGSTTTVDLDLLTPEWVRSTWLPFMRHAEVKPFFFGWNIEKYRGEVIFGWTERTRPVTYSSPLYMAASLDIRGMSA
jgi:hypothetical protein